MTEVTDWVWLFNNTIAICQQAGEGVYVDFEKMGSANTNKLQDNPMALFERITELKQALELEQIIKGCEKEFFRACSY